MNKKGYTLIELLAVIMILAAIAIVVMPIMSGIISGARSSANEKSARNYINAVNSTILQNKTSKTNRIYDKTYTVADLKNTFGVTVSGTEPDLTGTVTVLNEKVDSYDIVINGQEFKQGATVTDTTPPTIVSITPKETDVTSYVTSLEVTVDAKDDTNGMGLQISAYSFDGGATWQQSNKKVFYDNGTYKIEVRDNANNISTQDYTVSKIASSTPTITITGGDFGSNFVVVKASVQNNPVGIAKMEYSIDNGSTWIDDGKNTTHTFGGLSKQTQYNLKARVTSNNGKSATSNVLSMITKDLSLPTYSINTGNWSQSKTVTIIYPTMDGQSMEYYYSTNYGANWIKASQNQQVQFTENGTIIAKATDSTNTVVASAYGVDKIDTTAPYISSIDGNSSTWTTSVTLSINASDEDGGSGLQISGYSFDGGSSWQTSNTQTFTANGTYTVEVKDNANNVTTRSVTINRISTASPTISLSTVTIGTSDIVVKATVTSSEMGIASIEYTNDSSATPNWTMDGTNTIHTFGGLTKKTKYTLRAKITDKDGKVAISNSIDTTTNDIPLPTYSINTVNWAQSKVVTISYPTMAGQNFTYSYSTDKGETWAVASQSQQVIFTTNGTVIAKVADSTKSVMASTYSVDKVDSVAPTIASATGDPTTWVTSTDIVVSASDEAGGSGLQTEPYSFDGGLTWQASNTKTITSNGIYRVEVRDKVNNIAVKDVSITKVSTTAPTITLGTSMIGSNYISAVATVVDNEMGIKQIEYSIDNGATWVVDGISTKHTFGGLTAKTSYTMLARATSNNGKSTISNSVTETTTEITLPTYSVSSTDWASSKNVTITYPTIGGQTLGYSYSLDKGVTWINATAVQQVTFTANGTIIARVTDSTNTVTASTYTVDKIYIGTIGTIAQNLLTAAGTNTYTYLGGTYLKGAQTNNYVWFNGFIWRIMGKDSDGNIRMITEEDVTAIPCGAIVSAKQYGSSYAKKWTSEYFYSHISPNNQSIIKDTQFCEDSTLVTDSASARTTCSVATVGAKGGLLSLDEYNLAGGSSSYLFNGQSYRTLTPQSDSSAWGVRESGSADYIAVTLAFGIRPVITISSDTIITGGDGTLSPTSNGYILNQTLDNVTNKKVSEVVTSGEYVKYDNRTYRVVEKDSDGVKLILDGTTGTYTYVNSVKNLDSSTFQNWLLPTKTPQPVKWYRGANFDYGNDYANNLSSIDNEFVITGTKSIGLIKVGEMMSGQSLSMLTTNYTNLGDVTQRYSRTKTYWTLTPQSDSSAWYVGNRGNAGYDDVTNANGLRPVIVISSDATITGGNGTLTAPFEVN